MSQTPIAPPPPPDYPPMSFAEARALSCFDLERHFGLAWAPPAPAFDCSGAVRVKTVGSGRETTIRDEAQWQAVIAWLRGS